MGNNTDIPIHGEHPEGVDGEGLQVLHSEASLRTLHSGLPFSITIINFVLMAPNLCMTNDTLYELLAFNVETAPKFSVYLK